MVGYIDEQPKFGQKCEGVAKFIPFCVLGDRSSNRRAIAKLSPENRNLARNARGGTNIVFARIGQAIVKQSLSHRRVTGN